MNNYDEKYAVEAVKNKSIDSMLITRLLSYLRPYKYWVFLAIFLLIVARAIEAWVPVRLGQLAQLILGNSQLDLNGKHQLFDAVLYSCFVMFGWIAFNYLLDVFNILIKNWVGQKSIFKMRTQIFDHIQRQSMAYFDHAAVGRLMTRAIHDVDQINQLFSESLIPLIGSFFLFIGILIGLFVLNWKVALLFCFICPIIWVHLEHFRKNQRQGYQIIRSIISAMNTFIQENLMGINIIRNFGLQKREKIVFNEMNKDHLDANIETIHYFSLFFSGIEFLQNLTMISVFVLLVLLLQNGEGFQVGTYFTVSIYCLMIFRPLLDLAERYNVLQSAMAAAERIFEILDAPVENMGVDPGLPLEEIESIVFDQVWFAYESDHWILRGLSFSLKKGDSIALVGATGSGKTSIANILMRFYPFQKGNIYINNQEIHKYSVATLRKQFSAILQDPIIFSGTIFDNIALYDPKITLKQVRASADYVNLLPIIERFPEKFDHILTERGIGLSAGEAQLISLARAVVHKRSVIIFDEATSNIDLFTEKMIQNALEKLLKNKTAIVIAHRLSTIQDVTRIFVLSHGAIAESGTHEQLLVAKGIYEKLYNLQFPSGF